MNVFGHAFCVELARRPMTWQLFAAQVQHVLQWMIHESPGEIIRYQMGTHFMDPVAVQSILTPRRAVLYSSKLSILSLAH